MTTETAINEDHSDAVVTRAELEKLLDDLMWRQLSDRVFAYAPLAHVIYSIVIINDKSAVYSTSTSQYIGTNEVVAAWASKVSRR